MQGGNVENVGGNKEDIMIGDDQEADVHVGGIFLYLWPAHSSCLT